MRQNLLRVQNKQITNEPDWKEYWPDMDRLNDVKGQIRSKTPAEIVDNFSAMKLSTVIRNRTNLYASQNNNSNSCTSGRNKRIPGNLTF